MKLKRGLSLITAGMMLLSSASSICFADDAVVPEVSYTGPQSIYYIDFEDAAVQSYFTDGSVDSKDAVNLPGITANRCSGETEVKTESENNYLSLKTTGKSDAQFERFVVSGQNSVTNADKYVIEYKVRPNLNGNYGIMMARPEASYGVANATFYKGSIRPSGTSESVSSSSGEYVMSYTNGQWYTVTVVYDGNYVDELGSVWTDSSTGTKYTLRDIYINGELLKQNVKEAAIVKRADQGTFETDFIDQATVMRTAIVVYGVNASQSQSADIDYIRYYASNDTFAAKLPQAGSSELNGIEVQFNNIPVKDDLKNKISVVDSEGNEVTTISSATINNNFNPGTEYAQSVNLVFNTQLDPGSSYKLKFDGLTDFAGNTLSTELDFSTKALEVYADNFKLMSGSQEQTTLADGTYNVSFNFTNETSTALTPVIAAALYNSNGVLQSLTLKTASVPANSDEAPFTVENVTLSGTSGGKLKLFALKSATDWAPVSAVQVIDATGSVADGTFAAELSTYETAYETESSVDGDTLALTTKVKAWDSAMSDRHAAIVMFKEGKGMSDVSLAAPLDTILGLEVAPLTEAGVTYKIPDAMGNYPTKFYISNSTAQADSVVEYFGKAYIDAGLVLVKDIVASEVDSFLTGYEKALSIDISAYSALSPAAKGVYANSIEALRKEKETFADFNDFYTAMSEAQVFANIKDGADIKTEIDAKLKDETEYKLWKETISENANANALSNVKAAGVLTYKQLSDTFEKEVVLCGIDYADNYSQTLAILEKMHSSIGIEDLSGYNDNIRKDVAETLSGNTYLDYTAVKNAFDPALAAAILANSVGGGIGGGFGGSGGGGGGGSSSTAISGGSSNIGSVAMATPQGSVSGNNTGNKNVSFTDLSGFDWASEAIYALAEKGIINGKAENSYAPADLITRAELTKLVVTLYNLKSAETESNFNDVDKAAWYYSYINAGVKNGIINGTGEGLFSPDMNVTREMAAAIIFRAAQKSGKVFEKIKNEFGDKAQIEEYALEAVGYLSGAGILNGDETGNVNPKAALTRAEAAVLLNNLLK